jgi:predicted metal-dependent RNase
MICLRSYLERERESVLLYSSGMVRGGPFLSSLFYVTIAII